MVQDAAAVAQLLCGSEEAIAQAGAFVMIAELLAVVGPQVLGDLVSWFGTDRLVEDLHGVSIPALHEERAPFNEGSLG